MKSTWPLTGRGPELRAIVRSLDSAAGVVLAGPSGVGKTRLAEECLAAAAERGFDTMRVAATHASAELPLGAYAAVLPEISPEPDLALMVRRIARAIVERACGRRIAILVDDAHLLDRASAVLTHQLAANGQVFVLATIRSAEPVPEPVLALWKDAIVERVELAPLSEGATAQLLAEALGAPLNEVSVGLLHERCRGNILFLREMVLAARESGALERNGETWSFRQQVGLLHLREQPLVSARLVELVESRLSRTTRAERAALEAIALGEPVSLELVEHIAPDVELSDLEPRGIVRIDARGDQLDVSLAHPVYAEVLRASLTPHRRRTVFRTLAQGLERVGLRSGDDLLRFASWQLEGGGESKPETMSLASRRAWTLHDLDLAERLATAAVRAHAGFEAEVFLAQLIGLAGRAEEAETRLAELVPQSCNDLQRTTASIARIDNLCYSLGRLDDALKVAEAAEASIGDDTGRDLVAAYRASVHQLRGEITEMVQVSAPLLNRASGRALVWACLMAAFGYAHSGRSTDAIEAAERGKRAHLLLADDLRHMPMAWHPSVHDAGRCLALTYGGRLTDASDAALSAYQQGVQDDSAEARFTIAIPLCRAYLAQGRICAAVRYAEENLALAREHGRLMAVRMLSILLGEALALSGDADRARRVLDDLDAVQTPFVGVWDGEAARARAWLAVAQGDLTKAHRTLTEAAVHAADGGALVAEAELLHDLARLGDPAATASRLVELAEQAEGPLVATYARHAQALTTQSATELGEVSEHFQALGALLLAAEASATAATIWRRTGSDRNANRADRRAHELADRCEGARTPALVADSPARAALTERLMEIAMLAAGGLSNKDIAERLSLSRRTVENKLYVIYEKLGVHSRTELTEVLLNDPAGR